MNAKAEIKSVVIFIVLVALIAGAVLLHVNTGENSPRWNHFCEHEEYVGFFDSSILEIQLQKSFVTGVTFSDAEDLINVWEDYFGALEIKKEHKESIFDKDEDGGGYYVTVKTETASFMFAFIHSPKDGNLTLKIDDTYYAFKSEEENPFEETYRIAAERYGQSHLWE